MKFRKKPIVVEAYKTDVDLEVTTVEGNRVKVPAGAYVVTDIKGFQYPCDAEIFEAIHEAVSHDEVREEARRPTARLTSDRNDPRLAPYRQKPGPDEEPVEQQEVYLVLSEEERAKGFVRPVRSVYLHTACGTETRMGLALSETYARDPSFYGGTYCVACKMHRPLSEFAWLDGSAVGS